MSYRRACYTCQKHRNTDDKTAVCECEGEFNVSAAAQANLPHQTRPLHPTSHGSVVECIVNGMTMALSSDHRSHFAHYATFLFDKPALIDSYNHWMQSWATRLNHRLASSFQTSVAEIARAVAQRHTPSRPNMDGDEEQDSFTQSIGVEYFVAQLREVYLV
ncbi:hypothetical protein DYB32_005471 [Aphanomyces invadans]|uniref:Uncharacterized protein n=1 Tax=Aphanomyces invadans TaxID=157072 RepID=A0A3R6ZPH7_9STRA|nr:hypothetical protein DYB32_005471 [Aphanomyces invadans]